MYVDVASYATGGDGTDVSPFTGWEQSVNNARAGAEIDFGAAYYTCAAMLGVKSGQEIQGCDSTIALAGDFHGSMFVNADESAQLVDVSLHNLRLNGNSAQQTRMNHAISLRGAIRAQIDHVSVAHFAGDCVIFSKTTGGLHPRGCSIVGGWLSHFGRNGISITEGVGILIEGVGILNSAGTSDPGYGIDIEPNDSASRVSDVVVCCVEIYHCKAGIGIRDGTNSDLVRGVSIVKPKISRCDVGILLYYASNTTTHYADIKKSRDCDIKAIGNACNNIVLNAHNTLSVIEEADGQYVPAGNLFR